MMKSFAFLLLFPLLLFSFYLHSEQIYRDPFPNPMDLVDLFRQVTHHLFHKLMMKYFAFLLLFPFLFFSLKGQLNKITGRKPFKKRRLKVMISNLEQVVVTMLLKLFKVLHPRVRSTVINAIGQLSIHLRPVLPWSYHYFVLPALAAAINHDRDRDVRLAAINATVQLSIHLGPVLLWLNHHFVLPALERAINDDPDRDVRLAAINATVQLSIHFGPVLPWSYRLFVLPALAAAICDFEDPDFQAASAMINFSKKYPQETPRHLSVAVGTLLEEHASYRLEILELRIREENIAWHEIRISTIEILVMLFEVELPDDTWTSTFNSLSPEQQVEFSSIQENGI